MEAVAIDVSRLRPELEDVARRFNAMLKPEEHVEGCPVRAGASADCCWPASVCLPGVSGLLAELRRFADWLVAESGGDGDVRLDAEGNPMVIDGLPALRREVNEWIVERLDEQKAARAKALRQVTSVPVIQVVCSDLASALIRDPKAQEWLRRHVAEPEPSAPVVELTVFQGELKQVHPPMPPEKYPVVPEPVTLSGPGPYVPVDMGEDDEP